MVTIRKSAERGGADHGWLKAKHSFSFASYYDPEHMGFRDLRVINEDRIAGGAGFPAHGHADMEIITYVTEGKLEHQDSMGTRASILPGEVQRMSAGTGVRHSEYNALPDQDLKLFQIWIQPSRRGLTPGYEQKSFDAALAAGDLVLVVSGDGRENSLSMNQDADVYIARPRAGQNLNFDLREGRYAWIQVVRGSLNINGKTLSTGDALSASAEPRLSISAAEDAEFLLFDLN